MSRPALLLSLLLTTAALPLDAQERPAPHEVAIVLFPGVELMDFAGPGEVFAAAGHGAFHVTTVAREAGPLRSMGFLEVTPGATLEDCPPPDVVVVPGGNAVPDAAIEAWLVEQSERGALILSVCNGASYLARAGLLEGLTATTHHNTMNAVRSAEPDCRLLMNRRFVDNGRIVTAAGISSGIDGALYVVGRILGEEAALETAWFMEYPYDPVALAELHAQEPIEYDGLAAAFAGRLEEDGLEAALVAHRRAMRSPLVDRAATENELNRVAYQLMGGGELRAALAVLRQAVERFPGSANARDSLSEALEASGERAAALGEARAALALVAEDGSLSEARRARVVRAAEARVARLSGGTTEVAYVCPPCGMGCDEETFDAPGQCAGCGARLVARTTN